MVRVLAFLSSFLCHSVSGLAEKASSHPRYL
jgi:hypothetical protein